MEQPVQMEAGFVCWSQRVGTTVRRASRI